MTAPLLGPRQPAPRAVGIVLCDKLSIRFVWGPCALCPLSTGDQEVSYALTSPGRGRVGIGRSVARRSAVQPIGSLASLHVVYCYYSKYNKAIRFHPYCVQLTATYCVMDYTAV